MRKIVLLASFLLALLFCAHAESKAEWVFPEYDEDIRLFVLAASSDDKNMLVYTMEGTYPFTQSKIYLLNPVSGVCSPLDFSEYASEEEESALLYMIRQRYKNVYPDYDDKVIDLLFERERIYDPYAYILSSLQNIPSVLDLRDDHALLSLPGYVSIIVNLKTGEAFIAMDARVLGPNGTYLCWSNAVVSHFEAGDQLIKEYLPELPEKAIINSAYINNDGTLVICACTVKDFMNTDYTFLTTDKRGNATEIYPLGTHSYSSFDILHAPDADTYVVHNRGTSLIYPDYFVNAESGDVYMLNIRAEEHSDGYVYTAEKATYDREADMDTMLVPFRLTENNELIALAVTGDSDLVKINLGTNEVTVLLSGNQWRNLKDAKFADQFQNSQTLLVSMQSHNGSEILSVYPGGAIRHEP